MKAKKKALAWARALENGDYLSSRRLTASTFGVKELNFCVRNGNRWDLFAIVTVMVIYSAFTVHILLFREDLQLHSKRTSFKKVFHITCFLKLVEIIASFLYQNVKIS